MTTSWVPVLTGPGSAAYTSYAPGGDKYLQFNVEYAMPVSDTVEFVVFYDAGNAFDNGVSPTLTGMKVDYREKITPTSFSASEPRSDP